MTTRNSDQHKKVTTVYLVRHGTTAWNQALRYQGRADIPLDEVGERQGACLMEYFKDIHVHQFRQGPFLSGLSFVTDLLGILAIT